MDQADRVDPAAGGAKRGFAPPGAFWRAWLAVPDNRRFSMALLASLALHGWLLLLPASRTTAAVSQGALTVSFVSRVAAPPAEALQTQGRTQELAAMVKPASERPEPVLSLRPAKRAGLTPPDKSASGTDRETRKDKLQSGPGETDPRPRRPGDASVIMLVDAGGRPGQIFWNKLPALTDEQLRIVEARIREYRYERAFRGQPVNEVINVFDILRGNLNLGGRSACTDCPAPEPAANR